MALGEAGTTRARGGEGDGRAGGHLCRAGLAPWGSKRSSPPRDAKLRHSGEGAALAGGFPMRLCHLFPGFGRKEGHRRLWGWS